MIAIALSLWGLAALNADVLRAPPTAAISTWARSSCCSSRPRRFAASASRAATRRCAVRLRGGDGEQCRRASRRRDHPGSQGVRERGGLAGLEISRDRVAPDLVLDPENSDTGDAIDAGSYLSAVDAFGSPAYSSEQLVDAPEQARGAADRVLVNALGISLAAAGGPAPAGPAPDRYRGERARRPGAGCVEISPDPASGQSLVQLPPRGAWIENLRGAGRPRPAPVSNRGRAGRVGKPRRGASLGACRFRATARLSRGRWPSGAGAAPGLRATPWLDYPRWRARRQPPGGATGTIWAAPRGSRAAIRRCCWPPSRRGLGDRPDRDGAAADLLPRRLGLPHLPLRPQLAGGDGAAQRAHLDRAGADLRGPAAHLRDGLGGALPRRRDGYFPGGGSRCSSSGSAAA